MMLKNRLTALVAVAAIAVPALALAASKYSKVDGKGSHIDIGCKAVGLSFTAKAGEGNIKVEDDGTVIKVTLVDGNKLKTENDGRDKHMREKIFAKVKSSTVVLTVTHADLDAGLKSGNVKASLKFADKPTKSVTIKNASLSNGVAKGTISTKRSELGVPEACFIESVGPCVKDELEVDAAIHVKTE